METKHTPGPWRVQATGDAFIVESHTHTESFSIDENGERCVWSEYNEANARLIAAAPELLGALQKAVVRQGFSNGELLDARAAIAKAVGHNYNSVAIRSLIRPPNPGSIRLPWEKSYPESSVCRISTT